MKKLLYFLCFFAPAAMAADPAPLTCDALMAKLLRVDSLSPQAGFAYGFDDSVLGPLETVVNRRRQANLPVPNLELNPGDAKRAHRAWSAQQDLASGWERFANRPGIPTHGSAKDPLPLRQIGDPTAPVYLVEIEGKQKIFRPSKADQLVGTNVSPPNVPPTSTGAARRTVAASIIDDQLGADVVTPSVAAKVNGVVGSLSDYVPGGQAVGVVQPQMYFVPGKEANWRNVQGMEFLLGNNWSHGHNQLRDQNLHTWAIDFDQAFIPGVPRALPKPKSVVILDDAANDSAAWLKDREGKLAKGAQAFPFGSKLPEKYSREFVDGLRAYTPEKIRSTLGGHLRPDEIEGVIFRRELLLADADAKGAASLLPDSGKFRPRPIVARDSYPYADIWPDANPLLTAAGVSREELKAAALELAGIQRGAIGPAAAKLIGKLSPADAKHFAMEYLLHISGKSASEAPLRAKLIEELGNSPRATGRTIEQLLEISRGATTAADGETKIAAEAITNITKRIGSYPPRFEGNIAVDNVRESLLHQPIETIDPMLPKTNVYRVKLKNGVRGILKPRMQDRPWEAGRFDPDRIAYTRELEAKHLLEKFMGNEASRKAGQSRIWIPETVEVSPVINGKAYGPSSFQAFAEGYMPLDDFIKQNPDVWRLLARSPEWKETKARIMVLDYAQGNLDRLQNKANTAHFLRKLNLANIMVPKDLKVPGDLKVALIDNAVGRPGIPSFTIDFAPKSEKIPEDLKQSLRDFDFAGYAASARQYLSPEGAEDTIRRVQELRELVGASQ